MAEQVITPVVPAANPPQDFSKANAELAAKVAAQDIMGHSTATSSAEAGDALDVLAKQAEEAAKKSAEGKAADDEAAAKAEAEKKAAEEAAAAAAAAETPEEKAAKEAAAKAAAEAASKGAASEEERAKALFKDAPTLPQGAAPKSSEAFATVKLIAAREVAKLEQELQKQKDELKALKEASSRPSTEQMEKEKELADLRAWRGKIDVDFDPKFKEFDKAIETSREFIYAQLQKSPVVTPEILAKIKAFGGPDKTNLSKVFEAMGDPTLQRVIESKVADILMARYNKEQAVQTAKANFAEYAKSREDELNQSVTGHVTQTKATLDQMLPNLKWFKEQEIAKDATPEVKASAEDHNKFIAELRPQLDAALADDSPQMRAILITGMAQLFNTQREKAKVDAQLAAITKERDALQAKWEKIKSSSKSRLNESNANPNAVPTPAKKPDHTVSTGDALDALAKQVMEERQRKAEGATA
jgi:Predicted membrane protein